MLKWIVRYGTVWSHLTMCIYKKNVFINHIFKIYEKIGFGIKSPTIADMSSNQINEKLLIRWLIYLIFFFLTSQPRFLLLVVFCHMIYTQSHNTVKNLESLLLQLAKQQCSMESILKKKLKAKE